MYQLNVASFWKHSTVFDSERNISTAPLSPSTCSVFDSLHSNFCYTKTNATGAFAVCVCERECVCAIMVLSIFISLHMHMLIKSHKKIIKQYMFKTNEVCLLFLILSFLDMIKLNHNVSISFDKMTHWIWMENKNYFLYRTQFQ